MRWSQSFIYTAKGPPDEVDSYSLMSRAGILHRHSAGIFSLLPLGKRVISKVEQIIREEMNNAGAVEVEMCLLSPKELWDETLRWSKYGDAMFKLKDRKGAHLGLCPTHEEPITEIVRARVKSYRDLPITLYQIGPKFRDEVRPRGGLLRGREFGMKDAYSFDTTEQGMVNSYDAMERAYRRIFQRVGFDSFSIFADSGAIGGENSVEFVAIAPTGDVKVVLCSSCNYKANIEKAESSPRIPSRQEVLKPLEVIVTPGMKTVDALIEHFGKSMGLRPEHLVKTILYQTSEEENPVIGVCIRGDDEINELKLSNALGGLEVSLAGHTTVVEVTGSPVGFAGPISLNPNIRIFLDETAYRVANALMGINQEDKHALNVNPERDYQPHRVLNLRTVREGDLCLKCSSPVQIRQAYELGHIFQLGTVYSKPMGAQFLDKDGISKPIFMGCYGIGTTRLPAVWVEQDKGHDKNGIIWPMSIAPYQVIITPTDMSKPGIRQASESLYGSSNEAGIETLLDDREGATTGVKFKDADLIGIPLRVTIGSKFLNEGKFEIRERATGKTTLAENLGDCVDNIRQSINRELEAH